MANVVALDYSEDVIRLLRKTEIRALEAYGENWKKIVDRIIVEKNIIDTGALRESMSYEIDEDKVEVTCGVKKGYSAHGRTPENYAIYQELGTSKIPARPFIQPSIEEANMGLYKTIRQEAEYTGLSSTQVSPSIF